MSDVDLVLETLQKWADDPSLIDDNPRAKSLIAKIHREGARHVKKGARDGRRERDRSKIEATGRVLLTRAASVPLALESREGTESAQLERERSCPVCRARFSVLHPFYHAYCPTCAAFNWEKRHLGADLSGRIALVTGGRIKIGFECALKLLRCGARVVVTTRFAADASARYARQSDFEEWGERLSIVALDLKFLGEVERFCAHLESTLPHLDILVNNAAQTIARPRQFYASLLAGEGKALAVPEELEAESGRALALDSFFPPNRFDLDGQQVDLRPVNSWRQRLGEVDALEAAQCYVVSTLAPFVLTGQLRPLLMRSPHARRFVVQASAMEGNFSREAKTVRHPHTNMAKAALNMLVRTSAADLREDGIWCNAVDTGWITDENPYPTAEHLRAGGFVPPLDAIDGAARLLNPIFEGLDEGHEPLWGHFLKDYVPHGW
ncbi:SDR family oxidoreductase [bacterium]|nr:MAG: SDR family oxidoreductase [bacterium]